MYWVFETTNEAEYARRREIQKHTYCVGECHFSFVNPMSLISTTGHLGESTAVDCIVPKKSFLRLRSSLNNMVTGDALGADYFQSGAFICKQQNTGRSVTLPGAPGTAVVSLIPGDYKAGEIFVDSSAGNVAVTIAFPNLNDFVALGAKVGDVYEVTLVFIKESTTSTLIFGQSPDTNSAQFGVAASVAQPPTGALTGVTRVSFLVRSRIGEDGRLRNTIVGGWKGPDA